MLLAALGLSLAACTAETGGTRGKINGVGDGDGDHDVDAAVRVDADIPPLPGQDGGDPVDQDCDMTGVFALWANVDVTWEGTTLGNVLPVLHPGEGLIRLATLVHMSRVDGQLNAHVRACDVRTPDFQSMTVGEVYSVEFPTSIWESPQIPQWDFPLNHTCERAGCALEGDPLSAMLGVLLDEPLGAWPERRTDPLLRYKDHDVDGFPGLTMLTRGPEQSDPNGTPYARPPVDLFLTERASKLMMAIRMITQFDGVIDSCDGISGQGPGTSVETRAATCAYAGASGDMPCSTSDFPITSQATFIDGNLPDWTVLATHWTGVRIAEDAGCAEAREAADHGDAVNAQDAGY